jgi:hypothetical protein
MDASAGWAAGSKPPPFHASSHHAPHGLHHQTSHASGPRVHPALGNLPVIIPGGKVDPSYSGIPRDLETRLKRNEEDVEKLREDYRMKEEKLRRGLRGWERLERESKAAEFRSLLSGECVRVLAGEGEARGF